MKNLSRPSIWYCSIDKKVSTFQLVFLISQSNSPINQISCDKWENITGIILGAIVDDFLSIYPIEGI
jgi:hypothetical protein